MQEPSPVKTRIPYLVDMGRYQAKNRYVGCGVGDILWSVFSHVNLEEDLLVVGSREKEQGLKGLFLRALSFIPPIFIYPKPL